MTALGPLLLFGQLLFWDQGTETAPALQKNGIARLAVPPERAADWQRAGFTAVPSTAAELAARTALEAPQVNREVTVSSPTQRPWIDASGWRFLRQPGGRYFYDLPGGRAALAAAEARVFGQDVILKIDPGDLDRLGAMLRVLDAVPPRPWPDVAQIEVVDDQSERVGEVLNLLSRRNLLWRVKPPAGVPPAGPLASPALVVRIGSAAYPAEAARDPSEFANQLRHRIGDSARVLRVFGSESVLGRLQAADGHARLQLLNYGGGVREGLRVRIRGLYPRVTAITDRTPSPAEAIDPRRAGGATELTVPPFAVYAVVDLQK